MTAQRLRTRPLELVLTELLVKALLPKSEIGKFLKDFLVA